MFCLDVCCCDGCFCAAAAIDDFAVIAAFAGIAAFAAIAANAEVLLYVYIT